MRSILFLTSANLAANPRLTKELKLATEKNYKATVVQFRLGNWSDSRTDELKKGFPGVVFIDLSALRKPFLLWVLSSFVEQVCKLLPATLLNGPLLSFAVSKRSFLLLNAAKRIQEPFNWVIAHNPATFYTASWYGKRKGTRVGIDVEDYHPGETTDLQAAVAMKKLMQVVLPTASYCSYAAPLIAAEVQRDIPNMHNQQLIILNGFDAAEFTEPVTTDEKILKLVWFSQHIDAGRGLERVLPVVQNLYPKVELHLVGQLNKSFEEKYLNNKIGIVLHEPMQQKELHLFLATFDAGLATDIPVNRNREIALTNKIIAYAQAGLAIAATHTLAQDLFLKESDLQYEQMKNDPSSIRTAFLNLYQKKERGELNKQKQFQKGQSYAWQKLSQPLLAIWENNYA